MLDRLGLPQPSTGVRVGSWEFDRSFLADLRVRLADAVARHHAAAPLGAGLRVSATIHRLELPEHLRRTPAGAGPASGLEQQGASLVAHLAGEAGLTLEGGRVRDPRLDGGLGDAEAGVAAVEQGLRESAFAAPDRDRLAELGLGRAELAAAERTGRLLRLPDDVVLLPDGPARAMRRLAGLDQPFTLSAAREALGTTRRVAVPLLEHLDARGWTRRVDDRLRRVVRPGS